MLFEPFSRPIERSVVINRTLDSCSSDMAFYIWYLSVCALFLFIRCGMMFTRSVCPCIRHNGFWIDLQLFVVLFLFALLSCRKLCIASWPYRSNNWNISMENRLYMLFVMILDGSKFPNRNTKMNHFLWEIYTFGKNHVLSTSLWHFFYNYDIIFLLALRFASIIHFEAQTNLSQILFYSNFVLYNDEQ